jgi:hypothetical protein
MVAATHRTPLGLYLNRLLGKWHSCDVGDGGSDQAGTMIGASTLVLPAAYPCFCKDLHADIYWVIHFLDLLIS